MSEEQTETGMHAIKAHECLYRFVPQGKKSILATYRDFIVFPQFHCILNLMTIKASYFILSYNVKPVQPIM